MSDAMTIAAGGLQSALGRFTQAATQVAANPQDPAQSLVALAEARVDTKANIAVMQTADQMQKTLLDILA